MSDLKNILKDIGYFGVGAAAIILEAGGKAIKQKDLAAMAMSYGYVYVAQVAMGASPAQYFNAIKEADKLQAEKEKEIMSV